MASALAGTATSVSVVDIIKVPFQLVLGEKVGSVLQKVTRCLFVGVKGHDLRDRVSLITVIYQIHCTETMTKFYSPFFDKILYK